MSDSTSAAILLRVALKKTVLVSGKNADSELHPNQTLGDMLLARCQLTGERLAQCVGRQAHTG